MIDEAQKQEIAIIEKSNISIVAKAEAQQVANQSDTDMANLILQEISTRVKIIETKRLSFTAPMNQSLKEINNTFKAIANPLLMAKTILTGKVMAWRGAEQEKIRIENERIAKEEAKRRKIQEAHKARGNEVSEPVIMPKPAPLEETDTTKVRKVWKFEIVEAMKVPREYLTVNDGKIRMAVMNGVRKIEGVKIYQKETMVIGGGV